VQRSFSGVKLTTYTERVGYSGISLITGPRVSRGSGGIGGEGASSTRGGGRGNRGLTILNLNELGRGVCAYE